MREDIKVCKQQINLRKQQQNFVEAVTISRPTRSSAVAVIADRPAYDVYGILANYQIGFGYEFTNGWYARSDSTGRVYERTETLSTQA